MISVQVVLIEQEMDDAKILMNVQLEHMYAKLELSNALMSGEHTLAVVILATLKLVQISIVEIIMNAEARISTVHISV